MAKIIFNEVFSFHAPPCDFIAGYWLYNHNGS